MTSSLAAEISLHCIICFEEFDFKERPPVVLPCGHTYVCMVCAKRLRRCMECREPLYWTPPSRQGPQQQQYPTFGNPPMNTRGIAPGRYSVPRGGRYNITTTTPMAMGGISGGGPIVAPLKEEPIPLPLPKNTVLMGMMEAAERQAKLLEESGLKNTMEEKKADDAASSSSSHVPGKVSPDASHQQTSYFDPLIAGLDVLVGSSGTYAVREPLGLAVLPFDPNKSHQDDDEEEDDESDTDDSADPRISRRTSREPFTIEEGQLVQVVGVDEGVYQLARGAGYIVASVNQLVKVGVSLEKSCQFEGMLWSVQQKREELERALKEIDGLVGGLKYKIQIEQMNDPEYPIITPPKVIEEPLVNDENDVAATSALGDGRTTPKQQESSDPDSPTGTLSVASESSTEVNLGGLITPGNQMRSYTEVYSNSPAHSCPLPGTFENSDLLQPSIGSEPAGLPPYRIADDDATGLPWSFGCGTTLFGERLIQQDCVPSMAYSFDDTLVDSAMAGRAAANRSLANRTVAANLAHGDLSLRSGSFDGPINFRTGMSGHTGLNVSRKKSGPVDRPHIRMMSEHRGIAAVPAAHLPRDTLHHHHTQRRLSTSIAPNTSE